MKKYLFLISWLLLSSIVLAEIPRQITVQGILTDNSGVPLPSESYNFQFKVYDSSNNLIWSETQDILVKNGLFNAFLNPPENALFDKPYFLEITVNGNVLAPRVRITSSGYAFASASLLSTKYPITIDLTNKCSSGPCAEGRDAIEILVDSHNNEAVIKTDKPNFWLWSSTQNNWANLKIRNLNTTESVYVNGTINNPYTISPNLGDVNKDGYFDVRDLWLIVPSFSCKSNQPCWNEVVGIDNLGNKIYRKDLDLNGNNQIDMGDIGIVCNQYDEYSKLFFSYFPEKGGDINKDGLVNGMDFYYVWKSFGASGDSLNDIIGIDYSQNYIRKKRADLDDSGTVGMADIGLMANLVVSSTDYYYGITSAGKSFLKAGTFFHTDDEPDANGVYINIKRTSPNTDAYALDVRTGSISRLYVRSDGNIGIGTTTPSYTLDVNGNARITGNITLGYEQISNSCNNCNSISLSCPSGKKVLSGGCSALGGAKLTASIPNNDIGWICNTDNLATQITINVICARIQ
ncbi:MAG: hypothetical protein QXK49_02290 [Candidatus Aenigmatarchaeota archaeon]